MSVRENNIQQILDCQSNFCWRTITVPWGHIIRVQETYSFINKNKLCFIVSTYFLVGQMQMRGPSWFPYL